MTTTAIEPLDAAAVRSEALSWPETARAAQVTDAPSYTAAAELLKGIKALRQKIADTFDPHIRRAHDAHKALVREKADAEAPLTEAEQILKRALVAYDTEQERIRRAEEQRLREEARKEEERRRLEEAAALEREAQASGNDELLVEAEELIAAPVATPAVIVPKATPKVSSIVMRETWSARVVSMPKLIAFVAAHPEHANLLQANTTALNALARSLKGGMKVAGVEAVCQKTVAAGGR